MQITCPRIQDTVTTDHLNPLIRRKLLVITGKKHKYHKKYYEDNED